MPSIPDMGFDEAALAQAYQASLQAHASLQMPSPPGVSSVVLHDMPTSLPGEEESKMPADDSSMSSM